MTSGPAIAFDYRPPSWLRGVHAGVAALAVSAAAASGLPAWSRLLLIAAVSALAVRTSLKLRGSPVARVDWAGDGTWSVRLASGSDAVAACASFRILGALVVLRLVVPERRAFTLVLAPGNSGEDLRRRLRMRLRAAADMNARDPASLARGAGQ